MVYHPRPGPDERILPDLLYDKNGAKNSKTVNELGSLLLQLNIKNKLGPHVFENKANRRDHLTTTTSKNDAKRYYRLAADYGELANYWLKRHPKLLKHPGFKAIHDAMKLVRVDPNDPNGKTSSTSRAVKASKTSKNPKKSKTTETKEVKAGRRVLEAQVSQAAFVHAKEALETDDMREVKSILGQVFFMNGGQILENLFVSGGTALENDEIKAAMWEEFSQIIKQMEEFKGMLAQTDAKVEGLESEQAKTTAKVEDLESQQAKTTAEAQDIKARQAKTEEDVLKKASSDEVQLLKEEMQQNQQENDKRFADLEGRVSNTEQRLADLEKWKKTADATFDKLLAFGRRVEASEPEHWDERLKKMVDERVEATAAGLLKTLLERVSISVAEIKIGLRVKDEEDERKLNHMEQMGTDMMRMVDETMRMVDETKRTVDRVATLEPKVKGLESKVNALDFRELNNKDILLSHRVMIDDAVANIEKLRKVCAEREKRESAAIAADNATTQELLDASYEKVETVYDYWFPKEPTPAAPKLAESTAAPAAPAAAAATLADTTDVQATPPAQAPPLATAADAEHDPLVDDFIENAAEEADGEETAATAVIDDQEDDTPMVDKEAEEAEEADDDKEADDEATAAAAVIDDQEDDTPDVDKEAEEAEDKETDDEATAVAVISDQEDDTPDVDKEAEEDEEAKDDKATDDEATAAAAAIDRFEHTMDGPIQMSTAIAQLFRPIFWLISLFFVLLVFIACPLLVKHLDLSKEDENEL